MSVNGLGICRVWLLIGALLCSVFHKSHVALPMLWGVVLISLWIEDKLRRGRR